MVRHLNIHFNLLSLFILLQISWVQSKFEASSNTTISTGFSSSSSSPPSRVKYLPGFSGSLPFHLETGYISVNISDEDSQSNNHDRNEDIELFYYFVKSERKPEEDPLVLWFTGGPRCSSLSALLFEIGPITMDIAGYDGGLPKLVLNRNSWTKVANVIFPEAPVYTEFSYSRSSANLYVGDKESSQSSYEFVIKWLFRHPEFKSNPLYIGGDSYSGIIVPIVVQHLINDIQTQKYPFLNLKGYLLGNPLTQKQLDINARVPYAYGMGLLSYELFESMKENCKGKYLNFDLDNVNCSKDGERYQEGQNQDVLSGYWENDDRVQEALHVRNETVKKWVRCNSDAPYKYDIYGISSIVEYHRKISTKLGYRSLIYSGDHDLVVPHISTEACIRSLNLSIIEDWRPWLLDDQIAGYTRTYSSGLTYATLKASNKILS
ncbi:serine carboxypeptidase-like 7 [Papaver somniferum]|uniref:serine carboxypeptidase-like 7 n=1 Tax=Papaver somniferum TaxID=3469 RepID=UPI000E6FA87D|nr:serine carboxypeptidase-like 7 [Papaver somniferum]